MGRGPASSLKGQQICPQPSRPAELHSGLTRLCPRCRLSLPSPATSPESWQRHRAAQNRQEPGKHPCTHWAVQPGRRALRERAATRGGAAHPTQDSLSPWSRGEW